MRRCFKRANCHAHTNSTRSNSTDSSPHKHITSTKPSSFYSSPHEHIAPAKPNSSNFDTDTSAYSRAYSDKDSHSARDFQGVHLL